MEKILIVTNNKILNNAYTFFIEKYSASVAVLKASRSLEVLALLKHENYALVIIDMYFVDIDINSLELFLMLSSKSNAAKVLMVNVQPEDETFFELNRLGVNGLLSTKAEGYEFMEAIRAMIADGRYVSPSLAEKIFFYGLKSNLQVEHKVLTKRELQVMIMLGKGKRIKEIAEHIYLSVKTISTYKAKVYQKMGFKNTTQLVGYLLNNNLL